MGKKRKKKGFFDKVDLFTYTQVEPACPYFGECGGCQFQGITYSDQITIKEKFLQNLFGQPVEVVPAQEQYFYRNRMDFVYSQGKLGLRKKGSFKDVVDISQCSLVPKQFQELYTYIRSQLKEKNIPSYSIESKEGFLRYVMFRFAPVHNEVLVFFSTTTPTQELEKEFSDFLQNISQKATSVYWQINDSLTDTAVFNHEPKLILGKKHITERVAEYLFSYSPFSFFQNNTQMAQKVFNDIKKEVRGQTIDLCCGVGAITLYVADKARSIIGIEEVTSAIEYANKNKERNNISNALFFADDMKKILDYAPMEVDTLILDPPRAGLGSKVVKRALTLDAKKILYMSCNAKTQKIDIDLFLQSGYTLTSLKGYDLFPQTPHVETLAILEKE